MRRADMRPLSQIRVRFGPTIVHLCDVTSTDRPCVSCRAPILWVLTPRGKACPVNVEPEPDDIRLTHFATCPHAAAHRRAKQRGGP